MGYRSNISNSNKNTTKSIPADLERGYLEALKRDLDDSLHRFPHLVGGAPVSIFIGGGTPSLLSPKFYQQLIGYLAESFVIEPTTEITIEANPSSSECAKFTAYRRVGINRISIGTQSFSERQLQIIGRVHNPEDGISAYQAAQNAGFKRINLDLMFGLPHQTFEQALEDIQQALDLGAEHISHYQLTIEPNTKFAYEPPRGLPQDDAIISIESEASQLLNKYGLAQYEVSAWAKNQATQAVHNLNYWKFGDYLGIGAGAHSKITLPAASSTTRAQEEEHYHVIREQRFRSPTKYMEHISQVNSERQLTAEDLPYEFMLNALRLVKGFPLALFQQATSMEHSALEPGLTKAEELGLVQISQQEGDRAIEGGMHIEGRNIEAEDWLIPTIRGRQMLNEAIMLFAPA